MLKNYIKILLRNFAKNKVFTLINVSGLTLGITCSLIMFLIVKEELSFNQYHEKKDDIYRIGHLDIVDGTEYTQGGVPLPMIDAVRQDVVGLANATLVSHFRYGLISIGKADGTIDYYEENPDLVYLEPQFFEMFTWPILEGSLDNFDQPNMVVLSKELATKYFPNESAVGRTVRFNKTTDFQVIAVAEDAPDNSDFPFGFMMSMETKRNGRETMGSWNSISSDNVLFVELENGITPERIDEQLVAITDKYHGEDASEWRTYEAVPFSNYHFDDDYGTFSGRSGSKQMLWTYSAIGLFLIVTACFNFINMSTAMAVKRAKEVGMRKVLGSSRKQLVLRFIGETFFITLVSVLLSIALTERLLPLAINEFFDLNISLNFAKDPSILAYLLGVLVLVSLLAGLYPAVVLSSAKPINALKGSLSSKGGNLVLRRGLVVFQFFLCQLLIFGTVVAVRQMNFFNTVDMGYNKESILTFQLRDRSPEVQNRWRNELGAITGIEKVSISSTPPFSGSISATNTFYNITDTSRVEINTYIKMSDEHYMDTYGLRLVAGQWLSKSDSLKEIILNESYLKKVGITDPLDALGEEIRIWGENYPIVGIVQDFHAITLNEKIESTAIFSDASQYRSVGIKINQNRSEEIIAQVEQVWNEIHPEYEFDYIFVDDNIRAYYETEEKMSQMLTAFAGIAIFIGCLGLYGLVAFMANQKSKELGIRKVLGATVNGLVSNFLVEFLKLVGIAFLVAAPLGYFGMNTWLQDYEYGITIGPVIFIISFLASVAIAIITTGYRSFRAASVNPVMSLRDE